MRNIFAIGDIHGCYDRLLILIDKIDIDFKQDTLVFLGDYIDRGPDSFEVIEYLIDLKENYPNIIFLKGNHEELLEKYISGPDRLTYLVNGGHTTVKSYMKHNSEIIPESHLEFFKSLRLFYETEDYIFVHAGLRDKIPLYMQKSDDLLWIRGNFIQSDYYFGKRVIFGHTPFPEPLVHQDKIGIDTGAVYGNKLTCVKLPEIKFYNDTDW